MRRIKAQIGKNMVYFAEYEDEKSIKAGRLEIHDFWKWLEDKNRIYDELIILIVKTLNKQEVALT
ncbi:MAG: hypothetical protein AABY22_02020 [Nanoarchaeota archaeon]